MGHKEALLEGARRCIEEKGYARTTARDIVAASGTNLGSIGYHFGSKEALLVEAVGQGFEEWVAHFRELALAVPDASPLERLTVTWIRMMDDFPRLRPLLVALIEAVAQAERSPELRRRLAWHYDRCRSEIADTIRASIGGPDASAAGDVPDVLASLMNAVADGFAIQWLLDPDRTPSGQQLVNALMAGISYTLGSSADGSAAAQSAPRTRQRRPSERRRRRAGRQGR